MTMINDVLNQLEYLKLKSSYNYLNALHQNIDVEDDNLKLVYEILNKEVLAKDENNRLYNVKVAAFPFLWTIDDYDFSFQPSIKQIKYNL